MPEQNDRVTLMELADSWDHYADEMERECDRKRCTHNIGYREAARQLRQTLDPDNSSESEDS